MRFCSIASGSSGNCTYIGSDSTHILIDAGISNKRIMEGLSNLGISGKELKGILLTHEHSDHISGLKVFLKKNPVPIFSTLKTLEILEEKGIFQNYDKSLLQEISPSQRFFIGDLWIKAFSMPHDAVDPVAYRIENQDKATAVATDMGYFDNQIIENLRNVDVALIEANHDIRMLECGPYPYPLKRRILGDKGHLSNENAGKLISKILHDGIKHLFLGHLSKENNYPELAYQTVKAEIDEDICQYRGEDFPIEVAKRDGISRMIEF